MSSLSPMGSLPEAPWAPELCSEDPSLSPDSLSSSLVLTASVHTKIMWVRSVRICHCVTSWSHSLNDAVKTKQQSYLRLFVHLKK